MLPFFVLLALMSPTALYHAEATPEDTPSPLAAFFTYSSKDITYTIHISPSATYVVGGADGTNSGDHSTITNSSTDESNQKQDKEIEEQQQLYTEEIYFSATDAAGSVTVLPGSIVPSDVMSSLLGSSLPTTLVTATDASPTPSASDAPETTLTLSLSTLGQPHSTAATSLSLTWTVMQNGTIKTVVPTTTNVHHSTQTASMGLMRSPPLALAILFTVAGVPIWW